MFFNFTQK
jgi:hypothetical protein